MTMNIKDGTNNKTVIGTNSSSKSLAADFNHLPEILVETTKKDNLDKTKIAAAPSTNPQIKFNSALRTSGSNGEAEPCEYSTGDRSDECWEPVESSPQTL